MQSAAFSPRTLEAIYRFAFLLTGDAATASSAVLDALREGAAAAQFRNDNHRNAFMAMKVRALCLKAAPPTDAGEASSGFHLMPEPQRSALALFYLGLVAPADIPQLFHLKPEGFADALAAGRDFLRERLTSSPA